MRVPSAVRLSTILRFSDVTVTGSDAFLVRHLLDTYHHVSRCLTGQRLDLIGIIEMP